MARPPVRTEGATPWEPSPFAVWSEAGPDPQHPQYVVLRHPTAPFVRTVGVSPPAIDETTLQQAAHDYLRSVTRLAFLGPGFQRLDGWLPALDPRGDTDPNFGWMPLRWPPADPNDPNAGDPYVSFRIARAAARDGDQNGGYSAVLLASYRIKGKSKGSDFNFTGSEYGARVVAHVGAAGGGGSVIQIASMSASFPSHPNMEKMEAPDFWEDDARFASFIAAVKANIVATTGLQADSVALRGVRLATADDGTVQYEWRGTASAAPTPERPRPISYWFVSKLGGRAVSKVELVADADVFPIDPASQGGPRDLSQRRPTRSEAQLNAFRTPIPLIPNVLQYPVQPGQPDSRVVVCPAFVAQDRAPILPGATKSVTANAPIPVYANEFSAVMADWNDIGFFQRMDAYGIDLNTYFRLAQLPIRLAYRAGVPPGPEKDGQTVNARVMVDGWAADFFGTVSLMQRPGLEMHLALAQLSTRARAPWNPTPPTTPSPAVPLGIATDDRWVWHEIGHVLLVASVGELEFRFAHSAGDALAAIVLDPDSELADPALDTSYPEARGRTFPWVFVPRRHDRRASLGWSWCGLLHQDAAAPAVTAGPRRKGYWSEQILSSSLFRLYRSLGGDTRGQAIQRSASHYTTYLIMRGMQLLGPAAVVPARDPDNFVSALIDADRGPPPAWDVEFPPGSGTFYHRISGCAHKVIHWAFEAQGLYGAAGRITNGPGLPPRVDIYIEDRRGSMVPLPDDFAPGNYAPVPLEWDPSQTGSAPPPWWQASAAGLQVQGGNIQVTISNRGRQPATNVQVRVWSCPWPANNAPPRWLDPGWTEITPAVTIPNVAPNAAVTASFSHSPPAGRYIVLAAASCAGDRANTDTATGLPCSSTPSQLLDLVPSDNNLALRVVGP